VAASAAIISQRLPALMMSAKETLVLGMILTPE
jgi:hypothetical protein